jgi:hypothetical protein
MVKVFLCWFENGQFAECRARSAESAKSFVNSYYKRPVVSVELTTEYPAALHEALWSAV